MDGWTNSAVIPKLLRLGLHWGMHDNLHPNAKGMIPKLLRLGLHWGNMMKNVENYISKFLSFYA